MVNIDTQIHAHDLKLLPFPKRPEMLADNLRYSSAISATVVLQWEDNTVSR
jgi:hypothetical protein